MRKLTKILLFAVLMGLVTVAAPAHAALQSFSPTPAVMPPGSGSPGVVIGGIPAWYQDVNGVSVQPCLNVLTCGLIGLGDPMFNEALPLSYPSNFPGAAFYSDAVAIFPVGTATARVVMAMEYTFIDAVTGALIGAPPRPANALGVPFQRHSLIISYPPLAPIIPAGGTFTLTHPWGVTTFTGPKCVNALDGSTKCSMTRDLPLPGAIPPNFAAALGTGIVGSQSTFLKDPLAPAGFLGAATAVAAFTGAAPGSANSISVSDPLGNTGTTTSLTLLVGQLVGLTATPSTVAFPAQKAGAVSATTTVTITNPSAVNPATLGPVAVTGVNVPDFAISLDTCSNATLPANGTCTFGVTFSEATPVVDGIKTALVSFPVTAPLNMPPVIVNVSGAIDNIPPTIISTIPADNAVNVPSNNVITATFSENVTNLNAATFTLTTGGTPITGAVAFDVPNKTAFFTPLANLITNATYSATITTGVTDAVGNALAQNFVWSFKTTLPDLVPPTVVAGSPPGNAVGIPTNTTITVTFSKQMNAATINASTFIVNGITASSILLDAATNKATFTPSVALTAGTVYIVTIKGGPGGMADLAQNTVIADFQFAFLTNYAPSVPALIAPADGLTGLSTAVTLTWTKATDIDGDPLTYRVFICSNPAFFGCSSNAVTASGPRVSALYFAGAGGLGVALFGLISIGGIKGRKRILPVLAVAALTGVLIYSCGGSGSSGGDSDTTPPTVPAGISATAVSEHQIDLAWLASSDNVGVVGYKVYIGGALLTSTVTGTSISITALTPSTNYCCTVNAHDAAGNESAQSNPACATTLSGAVAPVNQMSFTATGLNPSVHYFWKVVADDGKGGTAESAVWSFTTQ